MDLMKTNVSIKNLFESLNLFVFDETLELGTFLDTVSDKSFQDCGTNKNKFLEDIFQLNTIYDEYTNVYEEIKSITIFGGEDKDGVKEAEKFTFFAGEVICIVGATGAGKSQFLEDVEYLSQGDTPSKRKIAINGATLLDAEREQLENKLCARLSQNMNFIMDLSAFDFILLHAQSRQKYATDAEARQLAQRVIEAANDLTGEKFDGKIPVTRLSGGQSRALMIADIALISDADIILIDELENAGVNKEKALSILSKQGKIIFISTHDPILALSGDKRIVIKNGGIQEIFQKNQKENDILQRLKQFDAYILIARESIRNGQVLGGDIFGEA